MESDYSKLLKRARENLPESVFVKERFEIPKVLGHIQGNKTIITNFNQITSHLRRDPKHMLKFILKELATPGIFKNDSLIFGSKVPASKINEKVKKYIMTYVLCQECGKPDTKIDEEKGVYYLKCMACGQKHSVNA